MSEREIPLMISTHAAMRLALHCLIAGIMIGVGLVATVVVAGVLIHA